MFRLIKVCIHDFSCRPINWYSCKTNFGMVLEDCVSGLFSFSFFEYDNSSGEAGYRSLCLARTFYHFELHPRYVMNRFCYIKTTTPCKNSSYSVCVRACVRACAIKYRDKLPRPSPSSPSSSPRRPTARLLTPPHPFQKMKILISQRSPSQ